jgi:hypothetical protein
MMAETPIVSGTVVAGFSDSWGDYVLAIWAACWEFALPFLVGLVSVGLFVTTLLWLIRVIDEPASRRGSERDDSWPA